jgi:hypothetical protein
MMTSFLKLITPTLLILLFVYASTSKILNFENFYGQLIDQGFSTSLSRLLQYTVPISEILTVGLLIYRKTLLTGLFLSLSLLVVFSGYIFLVLLGLWPNVSCPCGGILNGISWNIHFAFNCCFIILNLTTLSIYIQERRSVTL